MGNKKEVKEIMLEDEKKKVGEGEEGRTTDCGENIYIHHYRIHV